MGLSWRVDPNHFPKVQGKEALLFPVFDSVHLVAVSLGLGPWSTKSSAICLATEIGTFSISLSCRAGPSPPAGGANKIETEVLRSVDMNGMLPSGLHSSSGPYFAG